MAGLAGQVGLAGQAGLAGLAGQWQHPASPVLLLSSTDAAPGVVSHPQSIAGGPGKLPKPRAVSGSSCCAGARGWGGPGDEWMGMPDLV